MRFKSNDMRKILTLFAFSAFLILVSCGGSSSNSQRDESSDASGEYHNIYTGERQSSYKGSTEQVEDIAVLDKMIEDGY